MRTVMLLVLLSAGVMGSAAEPAAARTWTDRTGRQLNAEFVGFADGKVQVKRTSDGAIFHVPLERFSDVDQAFVRSQVAAKTKPVASSALGTPLGKYMGVGQFAVPKVKSRVLTGLVVTGDQTEAKYEHGEIKARPDEVLIWVHFHTDEALQNDVAFDQFSVVVDTRSYPVLASASDLNAECFEVIRKATTQRGANKSTYLLFAIPQRAKNLRVVYGTTGLDLPVPPPAAPEATEVPAKASVKVSGVALDRGELTVEIDWGQVMPTMNAEDCTLVLLFQANNQPTMKLDAGALATLSDNWELGLLENGCTWVLRTAGAARDNTLGEVLQIISGGGKAKEGPDFRRTGKYPLQFKLNYSANARVLSTENVQVAVFQETSKEQWQQNSTSYRCLSNVVVVSSKAAANPMTTGQGDPNAAPVNSKQAGQGPKPDDAAKNERDTLGGNWTVKSLQQSGQSLPEDAVKAVRLVIKGDQITTFMGNMKVTQVTFSVDPAKTPKEIEWQQDGKVIAKGTYVLDNDMLLLNMAGDDKIRNVMQLSREKP